MAFATMIDSLSPDVNTFPQQSISAAKLPPEQRKNLAINVLAKAEPISHIASKHGISRKFLYQQAAKAMNALDEAFQHKAKDQDVLFYLPVTKAWLRQFIIALLLNCHSSYRGVMASLQDLLDVKLSIGTIHNTAHSVVGKAKEINSQQDLSPIRSGIHDEIFQINHPVLVGVDYKSTYCYLLAQAEHRDGDTWGIYLLDLVAQGFHPDYTIADGALGLRAGQKEALPGVPCLGDTFHPILEFGRLASLLEKRSQATTTNLLNLEIKMDKAKQRNTGNALSKSLAIARSDEEKAINLARDVRLLADWMRTDILSLAGPSPEVRKELFDFVVDELRLRESLSPHRIGPVRRSLENQRDDLLAFAGVLDEQLNLIAKQTNLPIALLYDICQLQALDHSSSQYSQSDSAIRSQLHSRFYQIQQLVIQAMANTPHASSMVENFNSRLRNYFFLRRHLGNDYLDLLRFFLNHRTFMRSEHPERVGKSPAELLNGKKHPHWLELLGFQRFRQNSN
jgi:hypothetical protein